MTKKFRTRNGPNKGRIHLRFTEKESRDEEPPIREVEVDVENIDWTAVAKWLTIAALIATGAYHANNVL
jgi:hypothetical protein